MKARRLTRSLTDRVLGGVCGGLSSYIGMNPWWMRVAFVVLGVLTAGTGVLIYLALWYLLPPQSLAEIARDAAALHRPETNPELVIVIGVSVIVMGLIVLARNLGVLSGDNGDAFLPLVVIGFGLVLLVKQIWSVV